MTDLNFYPKLSKDIVYPDKGDFRHIPSDFNHSEQLTIESGYFVFTMMPSLRCSLNCPHCYLTLDQRRNSPIMSLEDLETACRKVGEYYSRKKISRKVIVFYWYGGEPTEMGLPYMLEAFKRIDGIFSEDEGYYVRHDILTSLLNIDDSWFDVFKTWGRGHFQTSFDGLMRGKNYVKKWEKRVREAVSRGLSVSTISVVNNEFFKESPVEVLDYLTDLGVDEASFLPFMLNEQNKGEKYEKYAPKMSGYSDFMIELAEAWYLRSINNVKQPQIGQLSYIASRSNLPQVSNIAGQTMFLLPNGDFVLPDYKDGYLEYMRVFGNILKSDFESILNSPDRQAYLGKQITRNMNMECLTCSYKDVCIMEFWKENRSGDDCFGAKNLVDYVIKKEKGFPILTLENPVMF